MKILVFGDSHSKLLNITTELKDCFPNCRGLSVNVLSLSGATIGGFGKRESTLNSHKKFNEAFQKFRPDYICFALGQVDIELGLYYKTIVQKESKEHSVFITELASKYIDNIKSSCEEIKFPLEKVVVKGVNLSTLTESRNKAVSYTSRVITENIEDLEEQKTLNQILKKEFPTNSVRNMNHHSFNEQVRKRVVLEGMRYFDLNSALEDRLTGNIRKEFIPAFNDHHLVDSLFIRELHIQRLLDSITRRK